MNLLPTIQVKLVWDKRNEIRRFSLNAPYSFDQIKQHINDLFYPGAQGNFSLKYEDEDKDWITFSTNEELFQALHSSSKSNLLRIALEENDAWPQPTAPPVYQNYQSPQQVSQPPPYWERRYDRYQDKKQMKQEYRNAKQDWKAKPNDSKFIARFVCHGSIEDDTKLLPSTPFTKIWRFRNDGRIPWPESFQLLFVSKRKGDQMSGPDSVPFQARVESGAEFNASVDFVAPSHPGCYVGYWRLADMSGRKFGQRVRVKILVQPWEVPPASPQMQF